MPKWLEQGFGVHSSRKAIRKVGTSQRESSLKQIASAHREFEATCRVSAGTWDVAVQGFRVQGLEFRGFEWSRVELRDSGFCWGRSDCPLTQQRPAFFGLLVLISCCKSLWPTARLAEHCPENTQPGRLKDRAWITPIRI